VNDEKIPSDRELHPEEYEPTKAVQRWADKAMFSAEPSNAAEGPRVYLLSMTPDPLGTIAAACKMYKGEVVRDLSDVTDAERREYFEQVQRTHLQAPFEFVDFHFMIEGVTRAFTHQMVRQRTAVYAQESLRFAVKEDAASAVALPPSLQGAETAGPTERTMHLTREQEMRDRWEVAVRGASDAYNDLVNLGMPAEDARGLLPHNITTRLHYKTNLRNLMEHAGNRLCTQAQFEWRQVWVRIVQAISEHDSQGNSRSGHKSLEQDDYWQQELLSSVFRPICYLTGKCEFKANFDRACSIRNRVEANHEVGRPSAEWSSEMDRVQGNPIVVGVGPQSVVRNEESRPVFIGAIHPAEWLADPAAAREQ
jgi:flavin-dependent thymidylate synthase